MDIKKLNESLSQIFNVLSEYYVDPREGGVTAINKHKAADWDHLDSTDHAKIAKYHARAAQNAVKNAPVIMRGI